HLHRPGNRRSTSAPGVAIRQVFPECFMPAKYAHKSERSTLLRHIASPREGLTMAGPLKRLLTGWVFQM
ncbi:MAG: hypothetical protein P1U83_15030, partial [Roseovarius sp.]|nr:hypothetical protein [Roseovarius sp.]